METLLPRKKFLYIEGQLQSNHRDELFEHHGPEHENLFHVARLEDALNATNVVNPDAVVIDLDSALRATGLDLLEHLQNRYPNIYVFLLSSNPLPGLERMGQLFPLASRVYWYLLEPGKSLDLAPEIERIISKGVHMSPSLRNLIISSDSHTNKLSLQQRAILTLVSNGASNRAIAESLGLSIKAVEHQISVSAKALGISAEHSDINRRVMMAREYLLRYGGDH